MTTRPNPIPLRADYSARTPQPLVTRGLVSELVALFTRGSAADIANKAWPDEPAVRRFLQRAVSATATTTGAGWAAPFSSAAIADFLFSVGAPTAAASLLKTGEPLKLGRNAVLQIPFFTNSGDGADFVGELAAIPVKQFLFSSGVSLGLKKFAVIVPVTREIFEHSTPSIEGVLRHLLAEAIALRLDAVMFDANAATTVRPAGLLNGANAALAVSATGDIASDVAKLVGAVSPVALGSPIVLIASPNQAARLRLDVGISAAHAIFSSPALADKTVIALASRALVSASDDAPEFLISQQATLHMDDSAPLELSAAGVPPTAAGPIRSNFQTDVLSIRAVWRIDFALRSKEALAQMTAVNW